MGELHLDRWPKCSSNLLCNLLQDIMALFQCNKAVQFLQVTYRCRKVLWVQIKFNLVSKLVQIKFLKVHQDQIKFNKALWYLIRCSKDLLGPIRCLKDHLDQIRFNLVAQFLTKCNKFLQDQIKAH